jgi:hypothetical protein
MGMTASFLALWLSTLAPPTWTSAGPETVRVDWLSTEPAPMSAPQSTPVHADRTTCVNRPRPLRPRVRHLVRVRRYRSVNVAAFETYEVTAEVHARLRVDDVVELQSLFAEPDGDGWWR